jgi:hypothetical protein
MMGWDEILSIDPGESKPLRERIEALFAQQRETWPAFRAGEAALAQLERKTLTLGGDAIVIQVNPARRASTLAKTDAKAVAARPCFLCPQNMPTEERGVAFEDLVVLPNPFPILRGHCTVAGREHVPQAIAGRVGTFLRLAAAIGPGMAALYNGPRCGASAPDHVHFQAARIDEIPILRQLPTASVRAVTDFESFGRRVLMVDGKDAAEVQREVERAIAALQRLGDDADEPMMNLLAQHANDRFRVLLFPRRTHRPACYFASGAERLAISPAVLEMCGVLVATEATDFARTDIERARQIYDEVSIDPPAFERLLADL